MLRRLAALAIVAVVLTACGDDQSLRASNFVFSDTLTVYDVDISDLSYPTGLSRDAYSATAVPIAGGAASFDVAFRIKPDSSVDVIPAREVVSAIASAPMVGILKSPVTYDDLDRVPEDEFRPDTTTNVLRGETFLLQVYRSTGLLICYYMALPRVYSKVVIDSVNPALGAVYLRQIANPNCGYRSLVVGLPRD